MGHTLVLEIPEDVYEPLAKTAEQKGKTPEEIAVDWLVTTARQAPEDPVEKFIGALNGAVPDWADQHDRYIGGALTHEAFGEQRKD